MWAIPHFLGLRDRLPDPLVADLARPPLKSWAPARSQAQATRSCPRSVERRPRARAGRVPSRAWGVGGGAAQVARKHRQTVPEKFADAQSQSNIFQISSATFAHRIDFGVLAIFANIGQTRGKHRTNLGQRPAELTRTRPALVTRPNTLVKLAPN